MIRKLWLVFLIVISAHCNRYSSERKPTNQQRTATQINYVGKLLTVGKGGLRLRAMGSIESTIVSVLPNFSIVEAKGPAIRNDDDQIEWLPILSEEKKGFVSTEFLRKILVHSKSAGDTYTLFVLCPWDKIGDEYDVEKTILIIDNDNKILAEKSESGIQTVEWFGTSLTYLIGWADAGDVSYTQYFMKPPHFKSQKAYGYVNGTLPECDTHDASCACDYTLLILGKKKYFLEKGRKARVFRLLTDELGFKKNAKNSCQSPDFGSLKLVGQVSGSVITHQWHIERGLTLHSDDKVYTIDSQRDRLF